MLQKNWLLALIGVLTGAVNGLIGAGGGMILVPLLSKCHQLEENELFSASVCIILPICLVSLVLGPKSDTLTFGQVLPYLLGSAAGGLGASLLSHRIPAIWLHRILGILILWGGIRNLC